MSRFDKYEPRVGGYRAKLEAAITGTPASTPVTGETGDVGVVRAVSLNASGRVVIGTAGQGGLGIICPVRPMAAGETIDVMTAGEIAEFTETDETASTAGTDYHAAANGDVSLTGVGLPYIGTTVEAGRLVVRVGMKPVG